MNVCVCVCVFRYFCAISIQSMDTQTRSRLMVSMESVEHGFRAQGGWMDGWTRQVTHCSRCLGQPPLSGPVFALLALLYSIARAIRAKRAC